MKRALLVLVLAACTKTPPLTFALAEHWPARGVEASGHTFVLSAEEDTLQIDAARVPIGEHPLNAEGAKALAADAEHYWIAFANDANVRANGPHFERSFTPFVDGYVAKHRRSDHRRVASLRVAPRPERVLLADDRLYVVHFDLTPLFAYGGAHSGGPISEAYAPLTILNATTMTEVARVPVCVGPRDIVRAGDVFFVSCFGDEVVAIDRDGAVLARLDPGPGVGTLFSPFYKPTALVVSPVSNDVWVAMENASTLMVFDRQTLVFDEARTITLTTRPQALVFTTELIVALDAALQIGSTTIAIPPCVETRHLTVSGGRALLACDQSEDAPGALITVDLATQAVTSVPTAPSPSFVAVLP